MVIGEKFKLLSFSTSITLAQEAKYESSSFIGIPAELGIPTSGQFMLSFPPSGEWVYAVVPFSILFHSFLSIILNIHEPWDRHSW